jgi:hypothetical protein
MIKRRSGDNGDDGDDEKQSPDEVSGERSFRSPRKTNCGIALPSSRGGLQATAGRHFCTNPSGAVDCREHAVADAGWRAEQSSHRRSPDAASRFYILHAYIINKYQSITEWSGILRLLRAYEAV